MEDRPNDSRTSPESKNRASPRTKSGSRSAVTLERCVTMPFVATKVPGKYWVKAEGSSAAVQLCENSDLTIGSTRTGRQSTKKVPDVSVGDNVRHISSAHARITRGADEVAMVYQVIDQEYFYKLLLSCGEENPDVMIARKKCVYKDGSVGRKRQAAPIVTVW